MPKRTYLTIMTLTAAAAALALAVVAGCSDKDEDDDSKSTGYGDRVVSPKILAEDILCRNQLKGIHPVLASARDPGGKYPASLKDVRGLSSSLLRCPRRPHPDYEYVGGQGPDMPRDNVLIYAKEYVHKGKCNVLLLGGRVVGMTADELAAALAKTKRSIAGN